MSTPTPLYLQAFPDFDDELPELHGWEDTSWKNDACPTIGRRSDTADIFDLQIYIDYKDPSKRSSEHRYSLLTNGTEIKTLIDTDSWDEVLEEIGRYDHTDDIDPEAVDEDKE